MELNSKVRIGMPSMGNFQYTQPRPSFLIIAVGYNIKYG
jgi:hypothetical protein